MDLFYLFRSIYHLNLTYPCFLIRKCINVHKGYFSIVPFIAKIYVHTKYSKLDIKNRSILIIESKIYQRLKVVSSAIHFVLVLPANILQVYSKRLFCAIADEKRNY